MLEALREITINKTILLMSITYFMIGLCSMAVFIGGVALHVKELENSNDFYIAGMQIAWSLGGLVTGFFFTKAENNQPQFFMLSVGLFVAVV